MQISERKVGAVTVIDLKGEAKARGQYDGFQQIVQQRIDAGHRHFVVNLAECQWIDSAGLGELIRSFTHVMRQGGELKLASAPEKIGNILKVTNLTQVIELFETEDSAVRSFKL
jgi:anti-sigma B factor antagonist